jgi:uncharacterized protein YcbK (DUF882 family)
LLVVPSPDVKASNFFSWGELLNLPSWGRLATVEDGLTENILDNLNALALKMDSVRRSIGGPIIVHCAYRPPAYSKLVGGSETDVHTQGMAMDWNPSNMTCDAAKEILLPQLEDLGLRMEDNGPGAGWIHLDIHPVVNKRFFEA